MGENGEGGAPPPRRRSRGTGAAKTKRSAAKDRTGLDGIAGISSSFEWKTRDTKEQVEMRAIHDVLASNRGKDAQVKRFRTEEAAQEFAAALRLTHGDLNVEARGVAVFAMMPEEDAPRPVPVSPPAVDRTDGGPE